MTEEAVRSKNVHKDRVCWVRKLSKLCFDEEVFYFSYKSHPTESPP